MPKLYSANEWKAVTANLANDKQQVKAERISKQLQLLSKTTSLTEKIDILIKIRALSRSGGAPFSDLHSQAEDILKIAVNAHSRAQLKERISERLRVKALYPDFIPGISVPHSFNISPRNYEDAGKKAMAKFIAREANNIKDISSSKIEHMQACVINNTRLDDPSAEEKKLYKQLSAVYSKGYARALKSDKKRVIEKQVQELESLKASGEVKLSTQEETIKEQSLSEYRKGGQAKLKQFMAKVSDEFDKDRLKLMIQNCEKGINLDEVSIQLSTQEKELYTAMTQVYQTGGTEAKERYLADYAEFIEQHGHDAVFFNDKEREEFRAIPSNGKIFQLLMSSEGDDGHLAMEPMNTSPDRDPIWQSDEIIYAINHRGEMYVYPFVHSEKTFSRWEKSTHHTSAFSGEAVMCAGVIKLDENGMIRYISNESGHYQPKEEHFKNMVSHLARQGVLYENTDLAVWSGRGRQQIPPPEGVPYHNIVSIKNDIKAAFDQQLNAPGTSKSSKKILNQEYEKLMAQVADKNEPETVLLAIYQSHLINKDDKHLSAVYEGLIKKVLNINEVDKIGSKEELAGLVDKKVSDIVGPKVVSEINILVDNLKANQAEVKSSFFNRKYKKEIINIKQQLESTVEQSREFKSHKEQMKALLKGQSDSHELEASNKGPTVSNINHFKDYKEQMKSLKGQPDSHELEESEKGKGMNFS